MCLTDLPIADWNPNNVEASISDLPEVLERRKAVPVRFQNIIAAVVSEFLAPK